MTVGLDPQVPAGAIEDKWENHKFSVKLVNPANKRKFKILIVGTGLAGASAAASLAELGYDVEVFTFHDSPRRAHSIAAQGGINAAKNYRQRRRLGPPPVLRHDQGRRLPEPGGQRVPPRRALGEHHRPGDGTGCPLRPGIRRAPRHPVFRRHPGVTDFLLKGPDRAAIAPRRLPGADAPGRRRAWSSSTPAPRCSTSWSRMVGRWESWPATLSPGPSPATRAMPWSWQPVATPTSSSSPPMPRHRMSLPSGAAHRRGAAFANPCFTQIHPTCIPASDEFQSKLTLMSESLRNDGRIWVPKDPNESRPADSIPEPDRDYYLERIYPAFGNLVPRDVASRVSKRMVDERPRCRPPQERRLPRLRQRPSTAWAAT